MIRVRGYYHRTWTGKAAGYLPRQTPMIARDFPEFAQYHPATINVRFEPKVIVAGSDYRTPPIDWRAPKPPEVFDLVRCRLTFEKLGLSLGALMYVAHGSVHRLDPHRQEFLVERFVDGLEDGMAITMTCDQRMIELPYTESKQGNDGPDGGPYLARTLIIL